MIPFVFVVYQAADPYGVLASAVPPVEWKAVEAFVESDGPLPTFLPSGSTMLSAQRAVAARWRVVLEGLEKASAQPYVPGLVDSTQIVTLAKLASYASRARFADGDRHGALTLLLAGLTMAQRTRSADGEGTILRSFAENLNGIPLAECNRVRTAFDGHASPGTGLRLLRAHMRVEAYRWQWLKLPTSLKDAMPAAESLDVDGRSFRFEQTAGGYTLETQPDKDGLARSLAGPIRRDSERS
ncbi:hypothetical protein EON82_07015 [bacterium]|nr:MAG: hypothetical protein EON82_07015 [bacterium]